MRKYDPTHALLNLYSCYGYPEDGLDRNGLSLSPAPLPDRLQEHFLTPTITTVHCLNLILMASNSKAGFESFGRLVKLSNKDSTLASRAFSDSNDS